MKAFTDHPNSVGESYIEHMGTSFGFGWRMILAGLGCFLHGLFPFFCTRTGSRTIVDLHSRMVLHRDKRMNDCDDLKSEFIPGE